MGKKMIKYKHNVFVLPSEMYLFIKLKYWGMFCSVVNKDISVFNPSTDLLSAVFYGPEFYLVLAFGSAHSRDGVLLSASVD